MPQGLAELLQNLESLISGEMAVEGLIAYGIAAVPALSELLLHRKARTVSSPRCRAARVLGALGAREALMAYLREYPAPEDSQILFAEDAVRSTVGLQLRQWKTEDVYQTIWTAVQQRPTIGLIESLGDFRKNESVPLLADVLEDDFCREEAKSALKGTPEPTRRFLLQFLSQTHAAVNPAGFHRCQAMLEILVDIGVTSDEYAQLTPFLHSGEPSLVIPAAKLAPSSENGEIALTVVNALLDLRVNINWLQEAEIIELLEDHRNITEVRVRTLAARRFASQRDVNWLSPSWRIFHRFLCHHPRTSPQHRGLDRDNPGGVHPKSSS